MSINFRRQRMRLAGFDYSGAGAYFITVCTRERLCLFGAVVGGEMQVNSAGVVVASCWSKIPQHFPAVTLDAFVVMPNHVHGILLLEDVEAGHARPLPMIVGSFKSAVSRRIGRRMWQRSYWDRIIRGEDELNRFRHYVDDNPAHWPYDHENPASHPRASWYNS